MEREVERICLLLSKLLDENRLDDLLRIIEDDEYTIDARVQYFMKKVFSQDFSSFANKFFDTNQIEPML